MSEVAIITGGGSGLGQSTTVRMADYGKDGLRVNSVAPGTTGTPMIETFFANI